jgi:hypothetical protein
MAGVLNVNKRSGSDRAEIEKLVLAMPDVVKFNII